MRNGESVACSLGMSPQSGLPHNNRVGDFDVFALPVILTRDRQDPRRSARRSWPTSRASRASAEPGRDLRDIEEAAAQGNAEGAARHRRLHRLDPPLPGRLSCSSSTAPTRSSSPAASAKTRTVIRAGVCRDLSWFGIELDPASNAGGAAERLVSTPGSRVQVWSVPTNEEIVVARQAKQLLEQANEEVSSRCSWPE